MSTQILGTGLSGLVGSRIVELNPDYQFQDLSLDTGFDILLPESIDSAFKKSPADTVIHLAAFTNTEAAWKERGNKLGLCWQLNVEGTRNIAKLCGKYNKHLIHISTEYVFDGRKNSPYIETDSPNPLDWYGTTKYEAEQVILGQGLPATIIRIAFPYRANYDKKIDFIRKTKQKLEKCEKVIMFTDQVITPTFADDIALGLRYFIEKKTKGIYHLVGSTSVSPYDLAQAIAATFLLNRELIKPSSLSEYLRLNPEGRPFANNLSLSNNLVKSMGISMATLYEGLSRMKEQLI